MPDMILTILTIAAALLLGLSVAGCVVAAAMSGRVKGV